MHGYRGQLPLPSFGFLRLCCSLLLAVFLSSCASTDDVERVESHVYDHQEKIVNLKAEIATIDQKRIELHDEVLELKLSDRANSEEFTRMLGELEVLDAQYLQLNAQLNDLSMASSENGEAIEQLQIQEARRQEIIRQHNDRWQRINESTDRKLSALDNNGVSVDDGFEGK